MLPGSSFMAQSRLGQNVEISVKECALSWSSGQILKVLRRFSKRDLLLLRQAAASPFFPLLMYMSLFGASAALCQQTVTGSPAQQTDAPTLDHAKFLIESGKGDEALQELAALRQADPGMKGIDHQVGLAYYRKGDFVNAQMTFANAIEE